MHKDTTAKFCIDLSAADSTYSVGQEAGSAWCVRVLKGMLVVSFSSGSLALLFQSAEKGMKYRYIFITKDDN